MRWLAVLLLLAACGNTPHFVGFDYAMSEMRDNPITYDTELDEDHLRDLTKMVNKRVNAVPYTQDYYWETPRDFFKNGGQCRDYVVAKYYLLYRAGVADSDMRMVVLTLPTKEVHAVLEVYTPDGDVILDNMSETIRPASWLKGVKIEYYINRIGWEKGQ